MSSDVAGTRPSSVRGKAGPGRPRGSGRARAGADQAVRPCPRDRLLAAADELFYAEGVHSVGIDRIIEQADVARASLYSTFGSKDELVRAYLEHRMDISTARLRAAVAAHDDPRERLLSVFDVQAALFARLADDCSSWYCADFMIASQTLSSVAESSSR